MNKLMIAGLLTGGLVATYGCSSDKTGTTDGPSGAVSGAIDAHCGTKVVKVDPGVCSATEHGEDAGADAGAESSGDDYGPTMYNAEGDDDDCKYHVKWTSNAIAQGTDESFVITLTNKSGNTPSTGAPIRLEVFLNDTHPAPNSNQTYKETSPGVYTAGPIRFDAPGRWTVRFHFNEQCNDGETSPHGHAAFFVQVP